MKPIFENINPNPGNSFYISNSTPGCSEPFWHIHPEYEIVYVRSGSAECHVGSHFSRYHNGALLMIGSNIPHSNLGNADNQDNMEVVIQMNTDFVEKKLSGFQELSLINGLFIRSKQGIMFSENLKEQLSVRFERMNQLPSFDRFIELLSLLKEMALSKEYTLLNAESVVLPLDSNDYNRVLLITSFVSENYCRQIGLGEVAHIIGLTESSFSRFFKRVTGKTFITFLNEYRIQKACVLLSDKTKNVGEVMFLCGFNEPAHFSRVFKKYTTYAPKDFQRKLRF